MKQPDLILGIDGGGTKTDACLAMPHESIDKAMIGRALAGPSNLRACGPTVTIDSLDRAVDGAFADAKLSPAPVTVACIGLAGVDRDTDRAIIEDWAKSRTLAARILVVHDGLLVLYAGTPAGHGVALIAGTGSFAFGRTESGQTARSGGWGPIFGDEGSGYAIAVAGLRAAARAADKRGISTSLLARFLKSFDVAASSELISAVYSESVTRTMIAARAALVFEEAERGDLMAETILEHAACDLAAHVRAVSGQLNLCETEFPLAVAGGILVERPAFRGRVLSTIAKSDQRTHPITAVADPVVGALILARRNLFGPA